MSTATAQQWREVTKLAPCPTCGKGDWCGRSGDVVRCMRVSDPPAGWKRIASDADGGTTFALDDAAVTPANLKPRIIAEYNYVDEHGELLFQVVRFEPKEFRQRRPSDQGGWVWSVAGTPRILYRLREIIDAGESSFIFIVEGEKDADRLADDEQLVATTCPQGAGKWHHVDDEPLRGRECVVLTDNDAKGRAHVQDVARRLQGKAASVRILDLPDLPDKGDVSDWLDAGGDGEELVRLAEAAPVWESSPSSLEDEPEQHEPAPAPPTDETIERAVAAAMLSDPSAHTRLSTEQIDKILTNEDRVDKAIWRLSRAVFAIAPNPGKDFLCRTAEAWQAANHGRYCSETFEHNDILVMLSSKIRRRGKRQGGDGAFDWVVMEMRAATAPTPPELERYAHEPKVLKLAKTLREAQKDCGDSTFYITQAEAARIMDRYTSDKGRMILHSTAGRRCLKERFVDDGILKVVDPGKPHQKGENGEQGDRGSAAHYQYIGGDLGGDGPDIESF